LAGATRLMASGRAGECSSLVSAATMPVPSVRTRSEMVALRGAQLRATGLVSVAGVPSMKSVTAAEPDQCGMNLSRTVPTYLRARSVNTW
jgi:hypothetical protein